MVEVAVTLRAAERGDAPAMCEVDRQCWPAPLATTAAQFTARIEACPAGQLVAISGGRLVGTASAQRITAEFLAAHTATYGAVSDEDSFTRSCDAMGEIYQLIGVGVLPGFRGRKLGRLLVDRQLELARGLRGVERIIGFTRPAGYAQHREIPIAEYVNLRDEHGTLIDPVLAFHVEAGAHIVSIHAGFRSHDTAAAGYGVLIEYPIRPSDH